MPARYLDIIRKKRKGGDRQHREKIGLHRNILKERRGELPTSIETKSLAIGPYCG
jgi:hypothetical protein